MYRIIIPAYNEVSRVGAVLDAVIRLPSEYKCTVVDDNSNDGTAEVAKRFQNVDVVTNLGPRGKTSAIRYAVKEVKEKYVILLDADLQNLQTHDIIKLAEPVINDLADMTISYRQLGTVRQHFINFVDPTLNGERCLKTEKLKDALAQSHNANGYQLEMMLNKYFLDLGQIIEIVPINVVQTEKPFKMGLLKGAIQDIKMSWDLCREFGIIEVLRQRYVIGLKFQILRAFAKRQ